MQNFDAVFQPSASANAPPPAAKAVVEDLAEVPQTKVVEELSVNSLTEENFKTKYPSVVATVQVNMGCTVVVHVVDQAVYIMSPTKVRVPGINSEGARPLFCYAGGSWISDPAKAEP